MKRLLLVGLCLILWALSTSVKATSEPPTKRGFSHRITGTAQLIDGSQIEINRLLGFARSSQGWYFRAGPDFIFQESPPRAYFVNIILDGQGAAYLLDFSDQPITHLQFEVEGQSIELSQTKNANIAYGMRLRINEQQFLFDSSHPRLRFDLTEQGISDISAERTIRDLSTRRVQQTL